MRISQANVLEAVHATQRFLDKHREILANVDLTGGRRKLDEVAEQLEEHALEQAGGMRASKLETARQRQFRQEIRRLHMKPIAAIARRKLRDDANFAALTVPESSITGLRFVALARDMATAAEAHAPAFLEQGLPAKFAENLRATIEELASSLVARNENRARHVGATSGLSSEVQQARIVFLVLDALVRPVIAGNDAVASEWRSATLISKRGVPTGRIAASSTTPSVPTTLTVVADAPRAVPAGSAAAAA